jgi:nucleoside-diphosphate-sugar epimerase
VAQSFGAFRLTRAGGPVQTEDEPIDPGPSGRPQPGLDAILYLERAVTSIDWAEGLALRYGGFYGPGTAMSLDPDAVLSGPVRRRRFPIVGKGDGITSYVHVDDAAAATVLAVERGRPGVYNIVDDEPAAQREWLPVLADALGAKPPRHLPRWLVRLLAGEMATAMMTDAKGSSNQKAKRELGWELRYPSWRQGFAEGLGERDA